MYLKLWGTHHSLWWWKSSPSSQTLRKTGTLHMVHHVRYFASYYLIPLASISQRVVAFKNWKSKIYILCPPMDDEQTAPNFMIVLPVMTTAVAEGSVCVSVLFHIVFHLILIRRLWVSDYYLYYTYELTDMLNSLSKSCRMMRATDGRLQSVWIQSPVTEILTLRLYSLFLIW